MHAFDIILKNEKTKTYRLITLFFIILHVVLFIYLFSIGELLKTKVISLIIIAYSLLLVLGKLALQKTSFRFSSVHIEKRNFPTKKYTWDQLSNVVLKDNILTLDFKDNKLLQGEIETTSINEDAFNTFAKEQLVNS